MKFYTHYSLHKGKVFVRYVDDDGSRHAKFVDYHPSYYVPTIEDSPYKSIYGSDLAKKTTPISQFRDEIKKYEDVVNYELYGTKKVQLQYIVDQFPETCISGFDINQIKRYEIDIETTTDVDEGFPNIEQANESINLITVRDSISRKLLVFHLEDVDPDHPLLVEFKNRIKYIRCHGEDDLFRQFVRFFSSNYPDILMGWNIKGFDVPFLINRIERVLGTEEVNKLSPLGVIEKKQFYNPENGSQEFDYRIKGIEIIDSIDAYKYIEKASRSSYSLDYISNLELGCGKLHHPSNLPGHMLYKVPDLRTIRPKGEWAKEYRFVQNLILDYQQETDEAKKAEIKKKVKHEFYQAYVAYNIIDVERSFDVIDIKGIHETICFVAFFSWSNISEAMSSMPTWTNLLYGFCKNKNVFFELSKSNHGKKEQYRGAYVKPPKKGRYSGLGSVVSYDVNSMYPNVIRALNLSPETIVNKTYNVTVDELLSGTFKKDDDGYSMGANGACFTTEKQGILPEIVGNLFNIRKTNKNEVDRLKKEIQEMKNELHRRKTS